MSRERAPVRSSQNEKLEEIRSTFVTIMYPFYLESNHFLIVAPKRINVRTNGKKITVLGSGIGLRKKQAILKSILQNKHKSDWKNKSRIKIPLQKSIFCLL